MRGIPAISRPKNKLSSSHSRTATKTPYLLKTGLLFYFALHFIIIRQSGLVYFWALGYEWKTFCSPTAGEKSSLSSKQEVSSLLGKEQIWAGFGWQWDRTTARWLPTLTKTVMTAATLFSANPAVWWCLKSNNKITNLRMFSPNVYVLALSFREMVPSFLSGRSVENGHNLLNFGEQGSQTRQVIYVVITIGKQSKDTRSLWMMSQ